MKHELLPCMIDWGRFVKVLEVLHSVYWCTIVAEPKVKVQTIPEWSGTDRAKFLDEIWNCHLRECSGQSWGSVAVGRIVLFALIPGTSRLQSNIVKIYVFIVVHFGGSRWSTEGAFEELISRQTGQCGHPPANCWFLVDFLDHSLVSSWFAMLKILDSKLKTEGGFLFYFVILIIIVSSYCIFIIDSSYCLKVNLHTARFLWQKAQEVESTN